MPGDKDNISFYIPPMYDLDQIKAIARAILIIYIHCMNIACRVVQLTTTGTWLSGQTHADTTLAMLLQQWGYKPVNTPLQVLYGIIMHWCIVFL